MTLCIVCRDAYHRPAFALRILRIEFLQMAFQVVCAHVFFVLFNPNRSSESLTDFVRLLSRCADVLITDWNLFSLGYYRHFPLDALFERNERFRSHNSVNALHLVVEQVHELSVVACV
ncbi:hypothetical protein [Prevotella koreensis]|uniref:hypothetical protein n=1 Tax=Prevotella koreensis TaxID=2490854 RepID=UPI0036F3B564